MGLRRIISGQRGKVSVWAFGFVSSAGSSLLLMVAPSVRGQSTNAPRDMDYFSKVFTFEAAQKGSTPAGWDGGPDGTLFIDETIKHSGQWAARIERTASSPKEFSTLTKSVPLDFKGNKIELRGFLRTDRVAGFAGLWMREDGNDGSLKFINMEQQQLKGSTDWKEYSVQLPIDPAARRLFFGVLETGAGITWADDLQLLVDGKPISDAEKNPVVETILDRDHEFDGGSKIDLFQLTPLQVENLATLGKTWGFLKYYHPRVIAGQFHWDYELFRILPAILSAQDCPTAHRLILEWIDRLGEISPDFDTHASTADVSLHADLRWIEEERDLGLPLKRRLSALRDRPASSSPQFFVSKTPVGNPVFSHEKAYRDIKFPDGGYQLLGLFRFWNIICYWSPYRDLIPEDWDRVLADSIPEISQAQTTQAYTAAMMALVAKVHDTHTNLWSSLKWRPPVGDGCLPFEVRFIEGKPLIVAFAEKPDQTTPFLRGDEITAIGGVPIGKLIAEWSLYYGASNDAARQRDIAHNLGGGAIGLVNVSVLRNRTNLEFVSARIPRSGLWPNPSHHHDLPGDTFQLLPQGVAYLKLSSIKAADPDKYIRQAQGAKGLILDLRNYPPEFVVFALGQHLVEKTTPFTRFTAGDLAHPGQFFFTPPLSLSPRPPFYTGKVVILVDEETQSQAEYTALAFRAAPKALVVGSTTAAADGNVSTVPLPGGLSTFISGVGVFYPDKRPTQQVGIVPDIMVNPSRKGIQGGEDEVLTAGLRAILGDEFVPSLGTNTFSAALRLP